MEAGLADLAPASPHGPCVGVARRVLRPTMLHGAKREDGGGIEDWMLDKLRSGEWRVESPWRDGAKEDWREAGAENFHDWELVLEAQI